jgi:hypothetical protein
LHQVAFAVRIALRESLVAIELCLRRIEQLARDDRGHVDMDPRLSVIDIYAR